MIFFFQKHTHMIRLDLRKFLFTQLIHIDSFKMKTSNPPLTYMKKNVPVRSGRLNPNIKKKQKCTHVNNF